jgi:transcriptional regulator with XRE-family HTH domain
MEMKGIELRRARERAGVYQSELAQACGVQQSTVSRWERGTPIPDDKLDIIYDMLGLEDVDGRCGEYVDDWEALRDWKMRVASRVEDKDVRLILITLDTWLDVKSWVVSVTREEIVDLLGGGGEHIDRALRSGYVDRIGRAEFTIRLKFPR